MDMLSQRADDDVDVTCFNLSTFGVLYKFLRCDAQRYWELGLNDCSRSGIR